EVMVAAKVHAHDAAASGSRGARLRADGVPHAAKDRAAVLEKGRLVLLLEDPARQHRSRLVDVLRWDERVGPRRRAPRLPLAHERVLPALGGVIEPVVTAGGGGDQ